MLDYLEFMKENLQCTRCNAPMGGLCQCCDICQEPSVIKVHKHGGDVYECKNCAAIYAIWEREGV